MRALRIVQRFAMARARAFSFRGCLQRVSITSAASYSSVLPRRSTHFEMLHGVVDFARLVTPWDKTEKRPDVARAFEALRIVEGCPCWRPSPTPCRIFEGRGAALRSLTGQIDTTTPNGRLIFHIFGAPGPFERDLICERTRVGLSAAAAR